MKRKMFYTPNACSRVEICKSSNANWMVIAFLLLFIVQTPLIGVENLAREWILKLDDDIGLGKINIEDHYGLVTEHYINLIRINEIDRLISIFKLKNFNYEIRDIVRYYFEVSRSQAKPKKEHLEKVLRGLRQLENPPDLADEYLILSQLAYGIGENTLSMRALDEAKKAESLGRGYLLCFEAAEKIAGIYKMLMSLKCDEHAKKQLLEMDSFAYYCPEKITSLSKYEKDIEKISIWIVYFRTFLKIKQFNKARDCLSKIEDILLRYPSKTAADSRFYLFESYSELGDARNARRVLLALLGKLIPEKEEIGLTEEKCVEIRSFLDFLNHLTLEASFFELVDSDFYLPKHNSIKKFSKIELDSLSTRLLARVYIKQKDFVSALKVVDSFSNRWKKDGTEFSEDLRTEILLARQEHDLGFDYSKWDFAFKDSYNNIWLDYNFAEILIAKKKYLEAKTYINRVLRQLNNHRRNNIILTNAISYDSVGELYWKLSDEAGLIKTLKWLRKRKDELPFSIHLTERTLLSWLIDVYLSKNKFESAWAIINTTEDPDLKCVGLIYSAKYIQDRGDLSKAKIFLNETRTILLNKEISDSKLILDEFYKTFFLQTTQ